MRLEQPSPRERVRPLSYRADRPIALALWGEIAANRAAPDRLDDPRPLAVVVYPHHDPNHAFTIGQPFEGLAERHRLMYYEAATKWEMQAAIAEAGRHRLIDVLYLSGHGSQDRIAFGGDHPDQQFQIRDAMRFRHLFDRVAPHGAIVLDSCSTGKGGAAANNLARTVARLAPHAHVAAAQESTLAQPQFAHGALSDPGFLLSNGKPVQTLLFPAFGLLPENPIVPPHVSLSRGPRRSLLYPVPPPFDAT